MLLLRVPITFYNRKWNIPNGVALDYWATKTFVTLLRVDRWRLAMKSERSNHQSGKEWQQDRDGDD